jgi:hypothetical protein
MRIASALLRTCLCLASSATLADVAEAQIVRGYVRSQSTARPIDAVTVTARDAEGNVLAMATTDSLGAWALRLRRRTGDVELRTRRLGFQVLSVTIKPAVVTDTIEYEFLLEEVAAVADEVRVTAEASLNERKLNEAYRRGWKVYDPELIAIHRDRSADLPQLLRSIGTPSLYLPRNANECIRASRNNQCLAIVVDGLLLGPQALVMPSDIYFLAVLGASEARVQFGDRAPWGAIAIYTRSRYDRTTRRP